MFEKLKAKLEAALAAATPAEHPREAVGRMREALVEMRAAIAPMRQALADAQRQREAAATELATADRRRELAAGINDAETVEIAEKYAAKLRERLGVLDQKVQAQQAELNLAEQDLAEMNTQFAAQAKNVGGEVASDSASAAWRELGKSGMDRPELDAEQELLKYRSDRARANAEADAKLEELKKRMGK